MKLIKKTLIKPTFFQDFWTKDYFEQIDMRLLILNATKDTISERNPNDSEESMIMVNKYEN